MKKVLIKYNPYLIETDIKVDGEKPKANSGLVVEGKRLQEWVDNLPSILVNEYRDKNFNIEFTGTSSDYEDIKIAFHNYGKDITVDFSFKKTADIEDVENTVDKIFNEIKNGPIPELRDKKIISAFEKAKNSKFEVNVIATMSSGKSTLINALLGTQLMPAANEATTATIVKIENVDQDNFSAVAYDKSGQIVDKVDDITLDGMKVLNNNPKVTAVEIKGRVPFVSQVGMKLVLVDTPGPNNSRDKNHEEMTYRMIADSDKSLVLYVMNGQQLGINDEKVFLDYVCENMKEGGKQSRERFIFAVNKMDAFKPKDEGLDCISKALDNVKNGLEARGIMHPNIFPVTAQSALEYRIEDDEADCFDTFKKRSKKYDVLKFNTYYEYNNLPSIVRQKIDKDLEEAEEEDSKIEIYTGLVSIERAIAQYVDKYARTTKIIDLVQSFNSKLEELAAAAHIQEAIEKDKSVKDKIDKQIKEIKSKIQSAQAAKDRSNRIDSINLVPEIVDKITKYMTGLKNTLNGMISGERKVEKSKAVQQCKELEKECKSISIQIKVQIDKILEEVYKTTVRKTIDEYKKYLAELNWSVNADALNLNPVNLISSSLADLSNIIEENTETADESYTVRDSRQVKKQGGAFRKAAHWLTFGLVDDYTIETEYYNRKVEKYVDYVDMSEVTADYLQPFQRNLGKIQKDAETHVIDETNKLKEHLQNEFARLDNLVNSKLDSLTKSEADSKLKAEEIKKKEADLRWLENIQNQVNQIIKF